MTNLGGKTLFSRANSWSKPRITSFPR